jgi:two-component system chemotaxis response regulator CheB
MTTAPARRIRVLVIDDSAVVRTVLSRGLARDPSIEVVGAATDPYEARDMLVRLRPDVLTLDIEMPRMDGITFLEKMMAVMPTPTIILSSLATRQSALAIRGLQCGAVDVVAKPRADVAAGLEAMMAELISHVKAASTARVSIKQRDTASVRPNAAPLQETTDQVLGLGASTGGVSALSRILPAFPAWSPGIVIVQHMPEGFTRDFALRLAPTCQMKISEARDGDRVLRGHILVAPGGDRHLEVHRYGGEYRVRIIKKPPVMGHCPSVDVLFASLADQVGPNASACLMTGMGDDGAAGLLRLRLAGGRTYAQDRETTAVWGMPAAAQALGAAEAMIPLGDIPAVLLRATRVPA